MRNVKVLMVTSAVILLLVGAVSFWAAVAIHPHPEPAMSGATLDAWRAELLSGSRTLSPQEAVVLLDGARIGESTRVVLSSHMSRVAWWFGALVTVASAMQWAAVIAAFRHRCVLAAKTQVEGAPVVASSGGN